MILVNKSENMRQAIIAVASKYKFEEKHALFVEKASLQIFNLLNERFYFRASDKLLLSHAALLHDIGSYINDREHHTHSKYLVLHDKGLDLYNEKKRYLLSLIVYNHRKKLHSKIPFLPKDSKSTVLMLSSILRVADALDTTRENITIKGMECTENGLVISVEAIHFEQLENKLKAKKALFCDIFDMDVVLQG